MAVKGQAPPPQLRIMDMILGTVSTTRRAAVIQSLNDEGNTESVPHPDNRRPTATGLRTDGRLSQFYVSHLLADMQWPGLSLAGRHTEARDVTARLVGRDDHDPVVEQELPNINDVLTVQSKVGLFRFRELRGLPDDISITDPSRPGELRGCTFLHRAAMPDKMSDRA
ncbi:hypothetical protein BJX62DRAFT_232598 [Aspergillus germanicus]